MAHEFPALAAQPETLDDLWLPIDAETGRPRVWDEHGMPLDSASPDGGLPLRHPDDYAHVRASAGYTPRMVTDHEGYTANEGLMDYMEPRLPEILHLCIDGARAYRRGLQIDPSKVLTLGHTVTLTVGLNSLWALLMYRTNNRVANGALPAHVGDMQRSFTGFEGLLDKVEQSVHGLGSLDAEIPRSAIGKLAALYMKTEVLGERWRCPSKLPFIRDVLQALMDPTAESSAALAGTLEKCPNPRLLADMHVADRTFADFAYLMRQAANPNTPEDISRLQRLLQLPS